MSVIASEYATFGQVIAPADKPHKTSEDFAAERRADQIEGPELLQRFGWSPERFDLVAARYGFPRATTSRVRRQRWGMRSVQVGVYSRRAVDAWVREIAALAAEVR